MGLARLARYLAPALLLVDGLLLVAQWYLQPERAAARMAALLFLACMTAALLFATRRVEPEDAGRRAAADAIRSGVVFGALILAIGFSAKLATTLGALDNDDLSRRVTMAILGLFLMFTGNALPKTLTPLPALARDAARVQACRRFAGWTWTLTGLAFAFVWLALPVPLAQPMSVLVVLNGMVMIAHRMFRDRRTWQRSA